MFPILFLMIFILIPIMIIYILKAARIKLLNPSIPSFFIWSYFIFSYIGILPLFFFLDEYRFLLGINDQNLVFELWLYSSISLFLVSITFLYCYHVLKIKVIEKKGLIPIEKINVPTYIFIVTLFLICILVLLMYLRQLPAIPLIQQIKGASVYEVTLLRSMATNSFSGKYDRYALFFTSLLQFISFTTFSLYLQRKNRANLVLFITIFLAKSFTALMTTEKGPFLWYIIDLFIVFMITRQRKITVKLVVSSIVISTPLLIFMYQKFMGMEDRSISEILMSIVSRTFTGQIGEAYFYLKFFPDYQDYLLGTSLPNPGGIFPWDHYNLSVQVMNMIDRDLLSSGTVGSAPTVFWGEMYANFGFGGIVLSSILVGFILYIIHYLVSNLSMDPISIGFTTWLIQYYSTLTMTGLGSLFMDTKFITVLLAFLLLKKLNSKEKITIGEFKAGVL